jgi:hypothetical protein
MRFARRRVAPERPSTGFTGQRVALLVLPSYLPELNPTDGRMENARLLLGVAQGNLV